MIHKNSFAILFSILLLILSSSAFAQKVTVDKIIGKVDNYMILQSDLENMYMQAKEENPRMTADDKCRIFESLIINKVMVAKAEIDSVIVEDALVEDQLDRRMKAMIQRFGTEDRIEKAYGKTIGELKAELRKQVKEQMTVQKMQEEINKNMKITPSEVRKFYNGIPKDSIPYFSTEVEVAQIVRIAKLSKEQKIATREKINQLRERIVNGEDFAVVAEKNSQDPGSAQQGGDLGWAERGMMVPEFEGTAYKLKKGEISRVFETEFGYHFLQLLERQGDRYRARHILLRPDYADTDVSEPTRYLDSLRRIILKDSITFAKAAKEYSEDKGTASNGGIIPDPSSGGTKIFSENLDPTIFFVIDTMRVGSVSPPLPYRTEDGKTAIRILYYKTKIAPHQANMKEDWEKLQAAALNEKRNKRVVEWFKKAKNDVFINVADEYKDCKLMEELQ